MKDQCIEWDFLKSGALAKKKGVVFLKWGLIPQCTLWISTSCVSGVATEDIYPFFINWDAP